MNIWELARALQLQASNIYYLHASWAVFINVLSAALKI